MRNAGVAAEMDAISRGATAALGRAAPGEALASLNPANRQIVLSTASTARNALPAALQSKTVSVAGEVQTLSGWAANARVSDFTRVSPQAVMGLSAEIGYPLRGAGAFDRGVFGQYFASHAERQQALLGSRTMDITQPMCQDCVGFFQALSRARGVPYAIQEPAATRLFLPSGTVVTVVTP